MRSPRPLDSRIESLVRHFATVFEWAIHNDVSWQHKLPAALARMSAMLEDDNEPFHYLHERHSPAGRPA
jgi:hypothetical protein